MFKIGEIVTYNNQRYTIIDKQIRGAFARYMIQGENGEKKEVQEICLRAISMGEEKSGEISSLVGVLNEVTKEKKIRLEVGALFQGIMLYWDKIEDAMQYNVKLYIKSCEISTVVLDRNTRYYTFQGLAPEFEYFVRVEAEDRNGKIIAISDKQQAKPDSRIGVFAPNGISVYRDRNF